MLIDVLTRVAEDTGLHVEQQRETLVKTLNRAASEMHKRLECNKVYWEQTLSVPGNSIVTLPSYIGELRGMRRCTDQSLISLHGMSGPRYCKQNWSYTWNNWRDLGESCVLQNPSLVGPLSITTSVVEDTPVTVMISGQTNNAFRIEESVTLDALTKKTTNLFGPQIYSIACINPERTSDITISDDSGVLLGVLYNMDNSVRYKVVDVSEAPWIRDSGDNTLVDVLYKIPLRKLTKDSDVFPASADFDDAWYWMSMWIYYKPLENKPADFESFFGNALMALSVAKGHGEESQDKKFTFAANKYFNVIQQPNIPFGITHRDAS